MDGIRNTITHLGFKQEAVRTYDFIKEVTNLMGKDDSARNMLKVAKELTVQEREVKRNVCGFSVILN